MEILSKTYINLLSILGFRLFYLETPFLEKPLGFPNKHLKFEATPSPSFILRSRRGVGRVGVGMYFYSFKTSL